MSGIISWLAGAPQAANTAGGYYQSAADQIANQYASPAAARFVGEQNAALRPQFQMQDDQLTGQLAGQGLASSGAGRAAFGNLAANQAATLAGAAAPLYQQGEQQYGNIISEMPGVQNSAYQDAITQFYQAVQMAGEAAAGVPPGAGGTGTGMGSNPMGIPAQGWNPQDPSAATYVPGFDTSGDQPWTPGSPQGSSSSQYYSGEPTSYSG